MHVAFPCAQMSRHKNMKKLSISSGGIKDPADKEAQFFCTRCRRRRKSQSAGNKTPVIQPAVKRLTELPWQAVSALRATTTHECHVRPHEFLRHHYMEDSGQLQAPSVLFSSELPLCTQCIMLSHPDVLKEQIIFSHGREYRSHLLYWATHPWKATRLQGSKKTGTWFDSCQR
jgi:hypothetical protein